MRHYIAYNNVKEFGPVDEAGPEFKHWTAKPKPYLEKTLGQNVWVISGEQIGGKMTYKLCHVFNPEKIVRSGGGHFVKGNGTGFAPHAEVTGQTWFGKLLDEQKQFAYGLNEIKDGNIIDTLLAFMGPPPLEDFPDKMAEPRTYFEGAAKPATADAYEWDRNARAACIAHYGACCVVCGFDFEAQYGERGKGSIHVHHLKPLSEVGKKSQLDPIKDLRPVCPNCHTIIHTGKAQLSVEEAQRLVRVRYGKGG